MSENVEDYPSVTVKALKRAADKNAESGCRFNEADFVFVTLPEGGIARVDLVRRTTNLGMSMTYLVCPECRRACRTLRLVPTSIGLACAEDLHRLFGAKYTSQRRK